MDKESAGKLLFSKFQHEHYHRPLVDFGLGDAEAYDVWVSERWTDSPQETKDKYQAAAAALIIGAQQSMQKDFADTVFYLNAEGKPEKIMSLEEMDDCAVFLSREFDTNCHNTYSISEIPFLAKHAIEKLKSQLSTARKGLDPFLDDLTACLRAFSLVATSIGDSLFPEDKDARLRGLVSMIESAIATVRNNRKHLFSGYSYLGADHFQSAYPVRPYIERISALKNEIKRLKGEEIEDDDDVYSAE